MKAMLRKILLPAVAVLSFLLTSCDANDLYLEDEIVGSWSAVYEDATVFEEEAYDFDPSGRWTYRYIYENVYGEYIYEVDAGTYYVRVMDDWDWSNTTYSVTAMVPATAAPRTTGWVRFMSI